MRPMTGDQSGGTWERPAGACPECRFDWEERGYELLVGQCVRNVAVFGGVLSRIDPAEAVEPGLWSASRYVWHTVDVLRFGTERLWTIAADPSYGVPTWDENVVAVVRSYDQLSPIVGLIALIAAADSVANGSLRGATRRVDPTSRGGHDLRIRRRPAERPRGLPPPVGRAPRHRRLTDARPGHLGLLTPYGRGAPGKARSQSSTRPVSAFVLTVETTADTQGRGCTPTSNSNPVLTPSSWYGHHLRVQRPSGSTRPGSGSCKIRQPEMDDGEHPYRSHDPRRVRQGR